MSLLTILFYHKAIIVSALFMIACVMPGLKAALSPLSTDCLAWAHPSPTSWTRCRSSPVGEAACSASPESRRLSLLRLKLTPAPASCLTGCTV